MSSYCTTIPEQLPNTCGLHGVTFCIHWQLMSYESSYETAESILRYCIWEIIEYEPGLWSEAKASKNYINNMSHRTRWGHTLSTRCPRISLHHTAVLKYPGQVPNTCGFCGACYVFIDSLWVMNLVKDAQDSRCETMCHGIFIVTL